jgi:hypothetical protein
MGRASDALKRAEAAPRSTTSSKPLASRDGNVYEFAQPAKGNGERTSVGRFALHRDAGGFNFSAHCTHGGGDRWAGTPRRNRVP